MRWHISYERMKIIYVRLYVVKRWNKGKMKTSETSKQSTIILYLFIVYAMVFSHSWKFHFLSFERIVELLLFIKAGNIKALSFITWQIWDKIQNFTSNTFSIDIPKYVNYNTSLDWFIMQSSIFPNMLIKVLI